ncbi:MAG: hypothetical protein V1882_02060, partial [Candidatus Omnitrophota bacterium]
FEKTELVTFLTPVILDPGQNTPEIRKFEDRKGYPRSFDAFGGYGFRRNFVEPLRYVKEGDLPYWEDTHDKDSQS